jgi:septum formation inhibitor-activating ATPase MinD
MKMGTVVFVCDGTLVDIDEREFARAKCGSKADIFQSGGWRKIAEELRFPFLGSIPIDQSVCQDVDRGTPFILEHVDSPASKSFVEIVEEVEGFLKSKERMKRKEVK